MKRALAILLPVLASAVLLLAGEARADGPSPGACFGGGNEHEHNDASSDGKMAQGQAPTTRRAGVGLLSAAFVTSGWLFLRRPKV
jgi:hypothetical protein